MTTDEQKKFTNEEQQKLDEEQLKLAINVLIDYHKRRGITFFAINSTGILGANGDRWEMAGLLDIWAEDFKQRNRQILFEQQQKIMEVAQAQSKTTQEQNTEVVASSTPQEEEVEAEKTKENIAKLKEAVVSQAEAETEEDGET